MCHSKLIANTFGKLQSALWWTTLAIITCSKGVSQNLVGGFVGADADIPAKISFLSNI